MASKKIRIGIITFHRAINCGAVLQAYALQKAFELRKNTSVNIVDMRGDRVDKHYSAILFNLKEIMKSKEHFLFKIIMCIFAITNIPNKIYDRIRYNKFIDQNLKLTNKCRKKMDLEALSIQYDFFVSGSDQVWNLKVTDRCKSYFLDFVPANKRNAYAASFGKNTLDDKEVIEYYSLIKDFENISVREKSGVSLVKKLIGKECIEVLDPIFLFDKDWWRKQFVLKEQKRNYIFLYMPYDDKNSVIVNYAQRLAKELNMDIVYVGKNRTIHCWIRKRCVTPNEWINYLLYSSYVITNSFHGTAFSINLKKDFWSAHLQPVSRPANNRIDNILENFGLEMRLLPEKYEDSFELNRGVAWEEIDSKLFELRKKSEWYIQKLVSEYE